MFGAAAEPLQQDRRKVAVGRYNAANFFQRTGQAAWVEGVTPQHRAGESASPALPCEEGQPMLLRHATPKRNLTSIRRAGLLFSKSQGRLPVVSLHATGKTPWAALHTVKRHGGRVESVVVLTVQVPRCWLRRSKRRLWCCRRDVPAARIRGLIDFPELACSPAAG
jgi:hypothetical protein